MSNGALIDLTLTLVLGALFGVIAFLLKRRFDTQDGEIRGLRTQVNTNTLALVALTEAQKAVVMNQVALSSAHSKLLDESEDLEDKTIQLDMATSRLQDRLAAHDEWRKQAARELEGISRRSPIQLD
jgi:hypothetical protein